VKTSNALNVIVSIKQIGLKQTSETVCTDGRNPDKIRDKVPNCGAGKWKGPATVSVEPVRAYYVGGMESDCLHFKPGADFHISGGINGTYHVARNHFILQKFVCDFPVTVTQV